MKQFCSVVVITFASHAKGPRFEPGRKHPIILEAHVALILEVSSPEITATMEAQVRHIAEE